jgi:hypothetical protein
MSKYTQRRTGKPFAKLSAAAVGTLLLSEAAIGCSVDSFSADDYGRGEAGNGTSGSASSMAGSASGSLSTGGMIGKGASGGTNATAAGGTGAAGGWTTGGSFSVAGSGPASGGSTGGIAGDGAELPPGGFAGTSGGMAAGSAGDGSGGFGTAGTAGSAGSGSAGVGGTGGITGVSGGAGVGAGGVPVGGSPGMGGFSGFAGFNTGGRAGAAAGGLGGLGGMGGAPVTLPFMENFEDGNLNGWNLQSLNAYNFAVVPGTGANNTARSLQLTKVQNTGFCCDGYNRQFPAGLLPKTVSIWLRADVAGTDAGYFRMSGSTDATQWLAYVYFYQTGLFMQAEQSLSIVYTNARWYHVEFRNIDWSAHRFEYWIDGVQLGTVNMKNPGTALKRIDLYGRSASDTTPATAYFDELELKP